MKRCLVTGAVGLLGIPLVQKLRENPKVEIVVSLVRDGTPLLMSSKIGHKDFVVFGDVNDFSAVNRTINEYQIDTVFHLAAQTQVEIANRNPIPTLQTNIMGTINVLEACRINRVERVIVASSDKAYGSAPVLPYDEETPLRGQHPYDVSKSCADLIAQMYAKVYTMNIGITRCGNLFGAHDINFNRLIPGTIMSILKDEPIVIRSDGKMIRDYFYVKDAANAYILLAEKLDVIKSPAIYNFSYGERYTVAQIVSTIKFLMDSRLPIQILDVAKYEIPEQSLDSTKALLELNWQPQWDLHLALKETIEWYKEEFEKWHRK